MLRVYLDQNKWVDLSRGFDPEEAEGAKFRDVALAVEAAVENGRASFPSRSRTFSRLGNGESGNRGMHWPRP